MNRLSHITEKAIDEWSMKIHEPRWLRKQRMEAWRAFQSFPEINWKKEKIAKLDWRNHDSQLLSEWRREELKVEKKAPEGAAGKITFHGNKVLRISLDLELANQGVIFCDLRTAVLERADLLESLISKSPFVTADKLSAFAKAFWRNGYFLFLPKGVRVARPFQVQVIQKNERKEILSRNIVLLEEHSSGVLEELFESEEKMGKNYLCSFETEVFVREGAHLQFYSSKNEDEKVLDFSSYRFEAERDAKVQALFSFIGAESGRTIISGEARAPGSRVQHDALFVGKGKQQRKVIAMMKHRSENTVGFMRYKGILKDHSSIDLKGLIQVEPNAQQSHSRLEEAFLLLSDEAKCSALPALNIQTDNVQVSHSAAITQVSKEKLFYIMSRGLTEESAKALLIEGFFEDLLSGIQNRAWYDLTKVLLESHL